MKDPYQKEEIYKVNLAELKEMADSKMNKWENLVLKREGITI